MAMSRAQVLAEVEHWNVEEKRALLRDLDQLLQERLSDAENLSPAWEAELRSRVDEIDRGIGESRPADQILKELRQRTKR